MTLKEIRSRIKEFVPNYKKCELSKNLITTFQYYFTNKAPVNIESFVNVPLNWDFMCFLFLSNKNLLSYQQIKFVHAIEYDKRTRISLILNYVSPGVKLIENFYVKKSFTEDNLRIYFDLKDQLNKTELEFKLIYNCIPTYSTYINQFKAHMFVLYYYKQIEIIKVIDIPEKFKILLIENRC